MIWLLASFQFSHLIFKLTICWSNVSLLKIKWKITPCHSFVLLKSYSAKSLFLVIKMKIVNVLWIEIIEGKSISDSSRIMSENNARHQCYFPYCVHHLDNVQPGTWRNGLYLVAETPIDSSLSLCNKKKNQLNWNNHTNRPQWLANVRRAQFFTSTKIYLKIIHGRGNTIGDDSVH